MKELEWEVLVVEMLKEHPEWMATTIRAMQYGVDEAIRDLKVRCSDIECGLSTALYKTPHKTFNKRERSVVRRAIERLRSMGGTKFQKDWLEKLSEENQ